MEIIGILKVKFETQKVSEKFSKREFVITTGEDTPYPQHVIMELVNDKCPGLDLYNVGDKVKVQMNISGREWNGPQGIKYFNTIDAWRLDLVERSSALAVSSASVSEPEITGTGEDGTTNADLDDLPF